MKQYKKTDQIFQERAFGLRRPHNFAVSYFFCLKNLKNGRFAWDVLTILQTDTVVASIVAFQKRTFCLRRPHDFVFKCVQKWKIFGFLLRKTSVSLETSSQFRVLSGVFSRKKQKSKSENSPLAWDVLTLSLPVPWSNPWKNDKCLIFWKAKRAFGVRRPHNFVLSPAFFFPTKKSKTKMGDLPETSSQFRGLLRAQIDEKSKENGSDFSRTGVWAETSSQFRRLAGFCSA